jgi:hypothetical protein
LLRPLCDFPEGLPIGKKIFFDLKTPGKKKLNNKTLKMKKNLRIFFTFYKKYILQYFFENKCQGLLGTI